jgi:uncharacterized protein (UPF0332 family)
MKRLLEKRRLLKSKLGPETIEKELEGARYDLERARASLAEPDFKWATIKAYYSMFHAARALLYRAGFRERSHSALLTALRELYAKQGKLDEAILDDFSNAMSLREEADYSMTYSEEGAKRVVGDAERVLRIATSLSAEKQGDSHDDEDST